MVSWRSWRLLGLGLDWALFGQLQKFWRDKFARSSSRVSATSMSSVTDFSNLESNLSNRGESLMIRLVIFSHNCMMKFYNSMIIVVSFTYLTISPSFEVFRLFSVLYHKLSRPTI